MTLSAQTIINRGERIEGYNLVEFRLIYEGVLPSSAGSSRHSEEKHQIRKSFHPQLRRLWKVKPGLQQLAAQWGTWAVSKYGHEKYPRGNPWPEIGLIAMGENWNRNGFDFVPLVTEKIALRCSVDILLLRPEERKYIFEQSDIDGQLKTLFDALRIPKNGESTGGASPSEDEKPFFCFLEDDRLISEVHVIADQLLLLPHERELKANQAFAVIHVRLHHNPPGTFDQYFA
jgi:hypothetical protein